MTLAEIIAELTGPAGEQAGAVRILETTRFEPELGALTPGAIADARRKAQAGGEVVRLLRELMAIEERRLASLRRVLTRALP